ncbi:MAG: hypothetical protein HQL28_01710 [Candidatus Omnitrophica bacterium]|nr:hypothetical protein [Candidatus Omnitrophota bacterium]
MVKKIIACFIAAGLFLICPAHAETFDELVVRLKAADQHYRDGSLGRAKEECLAILKINPRFYPAYNILGGIYGSLGDNKNSKECLEKSVQIKPEQPDIYKKLFYLASDAGETDSCIEYLKKSGTYDPKNSEIDFNIAHLYLTKKNDYENARKYYLESEKKNKNDAKTLFLIGATYLMQGDKNKAVDYVTKLRANNEAYLALALETFMKTGMLTQNDPLLKISSVLSMRDKH